MIRIIENKIVHKSYGLILKNFNESISEEVYSFHKSFPNYKPTPLIDLSGRANQLGVKNIWLKDESFRFDLNAFKVLGASYAIAKILIAKYNLDAADISLSIFKNELLRRKIQNETLVTATDGNHGRGVAWTAQQLGCNCTVYMPRKTTAGRYQNIKALGADVFVINGDYDEASKLARSVAAKNNWLLVQDSSWEGYEERPLLIMQGYLTLMHEVFDQLKNEKPTHVFIQCGVGSLPAAILAYLINRFGEDRPTFCVVEPETAACVYESFAEGDGKLHSLKKETSTIMAGLACETPSKIAWEILCDHANYFITCDDEVTIDGMKILEHQQFGDQKIISGESGAVTFGLVFNLLFNSVNNIFAEQLHLDSNSKIFLISTEGDTDKKIADFGPPKIS